jgi:hypothetical protein
MELLSFFCMSSNTQWISASSCGGIFLVYVFTQSKDLKCNAKFAPLQLSNYGLPLIFISDAGSTVLRDT